MRFQIKSINQDGRDISLSLDGNDENNIFTVVTGKNSTGKSRLLSKAVNSSIFNQVDSDVNVSENSINTPNKVIAISTGRFDKFPTLLSASKNKEFHNNYHYFGVKSSSNSPHSTLTRSISSFYSGRKVSWEKLERLRDLFIYLGFIPVIHVSFSLYLNIGLLESREYERFFKDYIERNTYKDPAFNVKLKEIMKEHTPESFVKMIHNYINQMQKNKKDKNFYYELHFQHAKYGFFADVDKILPLLDLNLLQVKDIKLINSKTKERYSIFHCSSGQQCMILMMMGIISSIEDNSLICIDEPEISLHPEWQLEFITILQRTFLDYHGCHFIIATHSPQIVSGLKSDSGYILSLEKNILSSANEHFRKSADFQLAEIFNAPGFRNEYLTRTLLVVLSKISQKKELSSTDKQNIQLASELKDKILENDPVIYLIHQVEMLVGKYE